MFTSAVMRILMLATLIGGVAYTFFSSNAPIKNNHMVLYYKLQLLILAQLPFWCLFLNYKMLWNDYVFALMIADTDIQLNYTSNKTNRFEIS